MTGPALSNYLSVLAVEVAGEVAAFKRSSRAAHVAVLTAGRKLVDARESARRGEWAPFLEAAGIEARTARNWMTLARAGLTPDDVTAAGGVQGAIDQLRAAKAESNSGIEHSPDSPKPPEFEGERAPGDAESPPLAHETGLGKGESRSMRESEPRGRTLEAIASLESGTAGGLSLYQWRRAMGDCTDCGAPADGAARCPACAAKLAAKRAGVEPRRRRIAAAVEAASRDGRGLSAAAVRRLTERGR